MQAWASFAQAGAVVFAAHKAADVFGMWRKQKIAERRIAVAERVLDVAYRVRRAFAYIRSPMMEGGALSRAEVNLRGQDQAWFEALDAKVRRSTVYSQAVYDRIESHKPDWDDLMAVVPVARAYFGQQLEDQLLSLWRQRSAVIASAGSYARDSGNDPDFSEQLNRALWEGYAMRDQRNEIDDAITAAFAGIEKPLQPLLDEKTHIR